MNIHEHQAKEILKKYGAVVPDGFLDAVEELKKQHLAHQDRLSKIKRTS